MSSETIPLKDRRSAGAIAGNPVGLGRLPVKYGSAAVAMPGYQVDGVDNACKPVAVF
jgi:hypothetical protein